MKNTISMILAATILATSLIGIESLPAIGASEVDNVAPRVRLARVMSGEKLFKRKCAMCHSIKEGKNKVGPSLYGVIDRPAGKLEGYKFSKALKKATFSWDEVYLRLFLDNSKTFVLGTKMKIKVKKEKDREALIEYLRTFSYWPENNDEQNGRSEPKTD